MNAGHWNLGDVVPVDETFALWSDDGPPRWHCLMVLPQGERRAVAFLTRRGVYAFHPVRRTTRIVRGKKRPHHATLLPGYVFARFPGAVRAARLFDLPFFTDAIRLRGGCQDGRMAVLDPADLQVIHDLRARVEEEDRAEIKRRHALRPRPGGRARILAGAFAGEVVEVLTVAHGRASVRLSLFGGAVPAELAVGDLVNLGA